MKRIELEKNNMTKSFKKVKFIIKLILIITILILIYIATPHCTQATKNIIQWLYELDEEYINRFWMGLLSLVSMISILFAKNKKQNHIND